MSDTDICSDDEKYGGFGAAMASSVAAYSAAPAHAVAAVAAVCAPGTKKSLPVTVAERIWKTKGRSKRQKKSNVTAHVLQAAAPAPVPLVSVDQAAARAPVGMKSPPVLPAALAVASAPVEMKPPPVLPAALAEAHVPNHPSGIVVKIVGTEMSFQGRSCNEHENCGEVLKEDVVVHLRQIQLMVEGKEETAIAAIWVMDGIDRCRVGFVPRHMVRHTARYDGALAQVTRVFSSDPEVCDTIERRMFFKNKGYCRAAIISTLSGATM